MFKSVLVIGSGLIAIKHISCLKKIYKNIKIKHVASRKFDQFINNSKPTLFDFIIICSPSSKHLKNIMTIEKNYKKKIVLVEKPLFTKYLKLKKLKNYYYVGYNLRHHPIITFIKKYLKHKKIYSVNVCCSSHLPNWRKNIDYKKSVSAQKKLGGGVLLELSHEIDYLNWILGPIKILNAVNTRVSDLKIDVDDFLNVTAKLNKKSFLNLNINFFSFIEKRSIIIDGKGFSFEADLINNTVKIFKNNKNNFILKKFRPINTYEIQIKNLVKRQFSTLCDINQALNVQKIISDIKVVANYN